LADDKLARDGFHPSSQGYRQWGSELADAIFQNCPA
jgi:lysophospholipase L1-like esterase